MSKNTHRLRNKGAYKWARTTDNKAREMVRRVKQRFVVKLIGWEGHMTIANRHLQGVIVE